MKVLLSGVTNGVDAFRTNTEHFAKSKRYRIRLRAPALPSSLLLRYLLELIIYRLFIPKIQFLTQFACIKMAETKNEEKEHSKEFIDEARGMSYYIINA